MTNLRDAAQQALAWIKDSSTDRGAMRPTVIADLEKALALDIDSVVQGLREELERLPTQPSGSEYREYDEALNIGLENLRDYARSIVDEYRGA